jgi:hypothetical protein
MVLDGGSEVFPRGLMVSAVSVEEAPPNAPCSDEKLKSLGFDGFLRDVLTGPEKVITMMCDSQKIHQIVCPTGIV